MQVFSELFDHWSQYTSTVSGSITLDASYESLISGQFSLEFMSVKSHMYNDRSFTTRVQLRSALYQVRLQPDSQLHPTFKSLLFEIAANIQSNNSRYARYLSELMVRQYGTHFVTSMDAGAVLSQVDHVRSSLLDDSQSRRVGVTASASANFMGKLSVGVGFNFSYSDSNTEGFVNNRTYSKVYGWGGPPYNTNMTAVEWENGIPNALVAVDRSGDPLYYAITPTSLPELPESTVYLVADFVSDAISRYHRINTRWGCTDVNSPSFDFQANIDDHSCSESHTNYTFGGVYQTCNHTSHNSEDLCKNGPAPVEQMNPLTGGFSCPDHYQPVLLYSGEYQHTVHTPVCEKHCTLHIFKCHNVCYKKPITSVVDYETFWCVATGDVEQNSGYLFGGYYTSTIANPFSGAKSCPRYFIPLHLGVDVYICVSSDFELGFPLSVPFAGFDSCKTGNPLATTNPSMNNPSSWPHHCPAGYTQHLLDVNEDCEINYCVKAGSFNQRQLLPPRLPPFRRHKQMNPNATETLVIIGNHGYIWYRNEDGEWVKDDSGMMDGKLFLERFNTAEDVEVQFNSSNSNTHSASSAHHSLSRGSVAGISVSATIALCSIIAFVVFTGYSIKKKRGLVWRKGEDVYLSINEENTSSADTREQNSV